MKWCSKDLDMYLQASEYVDTAIVPLIPITWGSQKKNVILKGEFPLILSEEIERQLKGRVFLFPAITYLVSERDEEILKRISALTSELENEGMPYPVFITSDARWTGAEVLGDRLVNIPPVPLEHMDEEYQREIVSEQVKHILQIVTKKWQNTF
ncbi:YpiF family protein [Pseudalkalibacillus salsuginis]|uniref:YpiF family protein n=1 Tax=Pseudalkalibacillus salsuginis TaxID=2910972 RepID=UPI001F38E648|nr:YpiF family protein [Pseudalkalibacillus salsuginis]MCF6408223.1 YpiF family protein [Pseudalkalibacillus salsuginis]